MYVCMYVYIYRCIYIYVCMYAYVSICTCIIYTRICSDPEKVDRQVLQHYSGNKCHITIFLKVTTLY